MNLDKLYKMQKDLDNYILGKLFAREEITMNKEELLDNTILALLVEVGELANTTRCFKHWSTKGMMDKEIVLDELADVWHFYLSIGNQTAIKFDYELARHMINHYQRRLNGKDLQRQFIELYDAISERGWRGMGVYLINIADTLCFSAKEVEQAYLKKHEENYKRQAEGY